MPINLLPIKHLPQQDRVGCLAACSQMALAHIGIRRTQRQLNRIFVIGPMGLPMSRIQKLHQRRFWRKTVNVAYQTGNEQYVKKQIDQNLPVILFVRTDQLRSYWHRDTQHALLCIGYEDSHVYLNDPAFTDAPKRVIWDELMLAWLEFNYMCAVISL